MTANVIAEFKVTDDAWIPEYVSTVHDLAARHGGRYLSRSASIAAIEGDPPDVMVVALPEIPSPDAAKAFADDPEYAPHRQARIGGSASRLYLIDDTYAAPARFDICPRADPGSGHRVGVAHGLCVEAFSTGRVWNLRGLGARRFHVSIGAIDETPES